MDQTSATIERTDKTLQVAFANGTEIEFALDGKRVLGIRTVRQAGVPLRNPAKLWKPYFFTPEGIHYLEFRLKSTRDDPGGAVCVTLEAIGTPIGIMDKTDQYLGNVHDVSLGDADVVDLMSWTFRPSELQLDGHLFQGFSFSYLFESTAPERKISRIYDRSTWEIGGHIDGNTIMCQGQVNPPLMPLNTDSYYTTACSYFGSEMRAQIGPAQLTSMQLLPRIGTLQAFDFIAHDKGLLFNYFDPLIDILSLIQKEKGEDLLHVIDELRGPLGSVFESHPKHILFCATANALTREERANAWCRALDFVHGRERKRKGIQESFVRPRVWMPQPYKDETTYGNDTIKREDMFAYYGDKVLPVLAQNGVKELTLPSLWVTDFTKDRFLTKNDTGCQGQIIVSGICCVREHSIDPFWGGTEALAYFVNKAHALDMQVQIWWATHLSARAPIYKERPDFMVTGRNTRPEGGGYSHHIIVTMDLANPDCFAWEYEKLKTTYEATGIDGFFHDSYGNMTFLPKNYADPELRCQQEAYGDLVAKLQKTGMKTMSVEGLGPWGVGHFGMNLVSTGKVKRGRYQNALDWWRDNTEMMYKLNMGINASPWVDQEKEAEEFSFRSIACGGRFGFSSGKVNGIDQWEGWIRSHNRIHAKVGPLTGKRQMLPKDKGVLWDVDEKTKLLFAYREFILPIDQDTQVHEIGERDETSLATPGNLQTRPWTVYRMSAP